MKKLISLFCMILLLLSVNVYSAEEEETSYSSGTVVKVVKTQITINELNDEGEKIDTVYETDKKTKYVNVDSLKNIPVGQEVEIEYVTKNKKRIAVSITLVQEEPGDDDGTDEGDEGDDDGTDEGY